jgi:hypothetical protein
MRSVTDKLLVKPGRSVLMLDRPAALARLLPLPDTCAEPFPDIMLAFVTSPETLAARLPDLLPRYRVGAVLWIAYPKLSGKVAATMTRDHGWNLLEEQGFLAVTQIALDTDWSAVRWRRRDEIRNITRRGG